MMGYEHWLEARRDTPQDKEILRVGKLKTIQQAEAKALNLRQWLADRAQLRFIDNLDAAHLAADMLANSNRLALDIETAKTDSDHPQAGLNPRLSRIRLIQYYDGRNCYLFDQYRIGSLDWIKPLLSIRTVG